MTCMVLLGLVATAQTPAIDGKAIDWKAQESEILRHYSALVQIDSSNPPGNETAVVNYLKKVFDAEGIPAQVFALDPARANLVARIKGNGKKRPILIMAHTDVVGIQREKWPVDPFGAIRKEGYIWGRGTVDNPRPGPGVRHCELLAPDGTWDEVGQWDAAGIASGVWAVGVDPTLLDATAMRITQDGAVLATATFE